MKDEFLKIYQDKIHRDGADKLLAWLEKSDFFSAPASSKYHLSREGGLCDHSVNVYNRLVKATAGMEIINPTGVGIRESFAVCGLLHDVCKVNHYKLEQRNAKDAAGNWIRVPFYAVDDQLPYGHGEKSAYIVGGFMRLTRDEAMAIRWHMGGAGNSENAAPAFEKYSLALMLHIADMEATFLDEREEK